MELSLPHGPAEFLVGHAAVILLLPPQLCHGFGFEEAENALCPILPLDQARISLRVQQNVSNEFPQVGPPLICSREKRDLEYGNLDRENNIKAGFFFFLCYLLCLLT